MEIWDFARKLCADNPVPPEARRSPRGAHCPHCEKINPADLLYPVGGVDKCRYCGKLYFWEERLTLRGIEYASRFAYKLGLHDEIELLE